jgi:hypothetical protein
MCKLEYVYLVGFKEVTNLIYRQCIILKKYESTFLSNAAGYAKEHVFFRPFVLIGVALK